MRCGEWLRAWPTADRLASKGIANHVALRLKLQGERGVLACATRAILGRMRLNILIRLSVVLDHDDGVIHDKAGGNGQGHQRQVIDGKPRPIRFRDNSGRH